MTWQVLQPDIGRYAGQGKRYVLVRNLPWGASEVSLFAGASPAVSNGDIAVVPAVTTPDNFVLTLSGTGVPVIQSGGSVARQTITLDVYDQTYRRWYGQVLDYVNNTPPAIIDLAHHTWNFTVGVPIADIDLGLYCTDINGDPITITALSPLPAGLTIAGSVLTGTPVQLGTSVVTFKAADITGEFTNFPSWTFVIQPVQPGVDNAVTFDSRLTRVDAYTGAKTRTLIGSWTADSTTIDASGAAGTNAPEGAEYIWTADGGVYLEVSSPNSCLLAWAPVAGALSYNIYQNNVLIANTSDLQYTVPNLAYDTTYVFQVNAFVGANEFQNGSATVRFSSPDPNVVYMARRIPFPSVGWN